MKRITYSLQALAEVLIRENNLTKGFWIAFIDEDDDRGISEVGIRSCESDFPDAVDASKVDRP